MKNSPLSQSVRQRLLNLSRVRDEDFQLTLVHFAIERLLYRLGSAQGGERFLLKGAMLFALWSGEAHRPTRDLDLAGRGDPSPDGLAAFFRGLCTLAVPDDGLFFDGESVQVAGIREQQEYQGQRVRLLTYLGSARIQLQVDIGFGDAVTPTPQEVDFPTLLDMPAPRLRVYPRETVVAEKLHAITTLGLLNSRMKDFYDLDWMAQSFGFEGTPLVEAIQATFTRRQTGFPTETPVGLTSRFADDPDKRTQWRAFVRRSGLNSEELPLTTVVARLQLFLMLPLQAASDDAPAPSHWKPGGPWSR
ncbi:MAG: nucleotidyl transferase AbiEii/AbiGii toxin family protein [Chloroflexi bacterium]|nr:nucleotidyl transferase AbiEii/AbiGii toxin family protein [Chloroflexota bacterium]